MGVGGVVKFNIMLIVMLVGDWEKVYKVGCDLLWY